MPKRPVPDDATKELITCAVTGQVGETTRSESSGELYLPPGWKRLGVSYISPAGMAESFCTRSPTVPVASVIVEPKASKWTLECCEWTNERCAEGWREFTAACRQSWEAATAALNWVMTEIKTADRELYLGDRLPKSPPSGSIQKAGVKLFPGIDSQSFYSLFRKATRKYNQCRLAMRRGDQSLPSFNYPQPIPVPANNVDLLRSDNNLYFLRVRISGKRFVLRLRGGGEFKRQLCDLRSLTDGRAMLGEIRIIGRGYRRCQRRDSKRSRLIEVSLSGHFPRRAATTEQLSMLLSRHDECFLFAQIEERPQWILNADHIRAVCQARAAFLQRSSEDFKFEKRWPSALRKSMSAGRQKRLDRYERRLEGWCWQVVASVLGYARRNRVGVILYDDGVKGYISDLFPWHWLRTMLENKCREMGMQFSAVAEAAESVEKTATVEADSGV